MPALPVYLGKNFNMYFLDTNDKSVRLLQGANVLDGTIYSYRGLTIGGGLVKSTSSTSGYTTDQINADTTPVGYAYETADAVKHIIYTNRTLRWDQIIYNTDIVLQKPPGSAGTVTRASTIRRPDNYASPNIYNAVLYDDSTLLNFAPKEKIIGGTIYIGAGQTLTVQGSKTYTKSNYTGSGNSGTKNVFSQVLVKPTQIVVDGGKLVIEASEDVNIQTDIYVSGGTLDIQAGAKIKGNIYVYNGGRVNVNGSFQLDSAHTNPDEQKKDGIFVYGESAIGQNGITSKGSVCVDYIPNLKIDGSANKIHLLGESRDLFYCKVSSTPETLSDIGGVFPHPSDFLCFDTDHDVASSGACKHFGAVEGEWITDRYDDH
jgi:hypothetical protein